MKTVFRDALVYDMGVMKKQNILFDGALLSEIKGDSFPVDAAVIDNTVILPGFCDVHVHFREPGFSYKEDMESGSLSAARGGYTAVMTMPNLKPVPDSKENLAVQLDAIKRGAKIHVYPFGAITVGEAGERLSDIEGMAGDVVGYSDDGRGVQSAAMMEEAMLRAKALGLPIVAHCEDNSLLFGGYIHDGEYARLHGHKGISSESEYAQVARDIELVKKTGCKYHVCHVSTKESVELIRRAKADGVDITAETGPHYLTMDDSMLMEDGRFKMNPPIRSRADREALVKGIVDGTLDMIATDHAPHSAEEKSRGLAGSLFGVVGLESAFAVLYTKLVLAGMITLEELVRVMSVAPRERFSVKSDAGFTVFDVGEEYEICPDNFLSKGRATPFEGWRVKGKCLLTVCDGQAVYTDKKLADIKKD